MSKNINQKVFLTFMVGVILCVTFCLSAVAQKGSSGQPSRTPNVSPTPTQTPEPIKPSSRSQGKLPFAIRDNSPLSSVNVANYQQLASEYERERTIARRNRLIFMAVSQIDLHFRSNERKVRHRNRLFQTVLDILEVGAATAISITNGERAKSIIADGLGFIQGSRESINENYRMLDRQILVNKMVEKRARVLATIYDRVGKSDVEYPFERAFIDLLDYFEAGRLDSALTELAKDSGSSAVKAETDLDKAKKAADITLASSAKTRELAKENEEIVQAIVESEDAARIKFEEAGKKATEAEDKIKTAKEKIEAAKTVIESDTSPLDEKEKAQQAKKQAEDDEKAAIAVKAVAVAEKTAAEKIQTAEMTKYKKISKAILEDPRLYMILDKLPSREDSEASAGEMEAHIKKVKNNNDKTTAEDYAVVLLAFYENISELVGTDADSVAKAMQILKEATKEEK